MASEEYKRFAICREMGWDYYTYEAQPPFFLEEIGIFLTQEAEKEKRDAQKLSAGPSKGKGVSRF